LTRNIELVIAYDGEGYCGWQIQPDVRTVQGVLNQKLNKLLNERVKTLGASRTDSGVHAHDQHVTFSMQNSIPIRSLERSLNHHLPEDIRLLRVREREPGFSARRSATGKHYIYLVTLGNSINPFFGRYSWSIERDLNIELMAEATASFIGFNDFKSLQSMRDFRTNSYVHIQDAQIVIKNGVLLFHVIGHSFLYNMVRNMFGALLKVGVGEWDLTLFQRNLISGDRTKMGVTAPSKGLHLAQVFYGDGEMNMGIGLNAMFSHFRL